MVHDAGVNQGAADVAGGVDISPQRIVVAGPTGLPPAEVNPGSAGETLYRPLIAIGEGIVPNAPSVAHGTGVHDKLLDLDLDLDLDNGNSQLTLELTAGSLRR